MLNIIINAQKNNFTTKQQFSTTSNIFWLNLLKCLGYDPKYTSLANMLKEYYALDGDWIIASPIYWEATHNNAIIIAHDEELQLITDRAKLFFDAISEFLAEENIKLFYHNAYCWLLCIDNLPKINSENLNLLIGKPISTALMQLDKTLYWQKILTELQMFLINHELNKINTNNSLVNGLWFWGGGKFDNNICTPLMSNDLIIKQIFPLCQELNFIKNLNNQSIVIFNYSETIFCKLQNYKQEINWYWNNSVYNTKRKFWWHKILK